MNKTTTLTLLLSLISVILFGQNSDKKIEPLQYNQELTKVEIDSLISNLRKEYYAKKYFNTISDAKYLVKKAEEINYNKGVYSISSILGNTFLQINDTIAAVKVIEKQLELAKIDNDSSNFLGSSIDLANIFGKQGLNDKAIASYKSVIPYAKQAKDIERLFILNYNIAEIYLNNEDKENAEIHVKETSKYIDSIKSKFFHAGQELILGRLFYIQNNPKEAAIHLKKAVELSIATGYTDGLIDGYYYYAKTEAQLGNFKNAYDFQQKVALLNEEKYNLDKIQALETTNAKFNLEQYKQDLESTELKNQLIEQEADKNANILMWVSIGTIALLLFLVTLLVSYFKRKKLLEDLKDKNIKYLLAKEKSEELATAKSLFFSNISHELRTPLYGIIGLSSILMDDKELYKHKEDVKSLKFSADYLLSLINDVLQISKLDSKQENSVNKTTFNLKDLINGIMKSFEFLKVQNINDFIIEIDKNVPNILIGDDVKLSQILINLIGNACKFTENGTIILSVKPTILQDESTKLHFTVKDTGIGIPKIKQELIFDEFTQVEKEGGEYQGTGLGLPIVKKLLELHNSEIKLISSEGEGTEISFEINYDIAEENYLEAKEVVLETKISIKGKNILVVDDNRINRIVTKKILEKYNGKPLVADGGVEAIAIAKANIIDLILMDVNMPGMDGLEATETIRTFNKTVPIIALTAVEIEEMRESIQNSTICDIIIKPYDEVIFVETILKHI